MEAKKDMYQVTAAGQAAAAVFSLTDEVAMVIGTVAHFLAH